MIALLPWSLHASRNALAFRSGQRNIPAPLLLVRLWSSPSARGGLVVAVGYRSLKSSLSYAAYGPHSLRLVRRSYS